MTEKLSDIAFAGLTIVSMALFSLPAAYLGIYVVGAMTAA